MTDTTKPTLSDEERADIRAAIAKGELGRHDLAPIVTKLFASLEEAEGREASYRADLAKALRRKDQAEQQVAVDRNTFGQIRRHTQYPTAGTLYDARNRLDHIAKLVAAALSVTEGAK